MKLKFTFASFIAAAAVLVGCVKENPISSLQGLTVSNDYITLASDENSSVSVTVNGEESWTASTKADWLTLSPANGAAGQNVTLTFTAAASKAARSTEVNIVMGGKTKIIKVNQAAPQGVEVPLATCKDVIDGPDVTYKVRGTVASVANTSYGNWYLEDETGKIYIYGTFNAKGQYPKDAEGGWASFGIEVGDVVTVEGPKTVYNGTVELVDVSIVKIEKSLIDVKAFDFDKLPCADTTFNMVVTAKESPLLLESDAMWLKIEGVNPDGSYRLHAAQNYVTADRTANIFIQGPTAKKSVAIVQSGIPVTGASVSEIIAMEDGSKVQTLPTSVVSAVTSKGCVLTDGVKAIYVYNEILSVMDLGDGVQLNGTKTTYNGVPEITDVTYVLEDSAGNPVNYPVAKDITAEAGEYAATEAEFVKLSGTLSVSGNYYNILLDAFPDGSKQGSIVAPAEYLDAASFNGKKITVTGYFNGISGKGKYINVIATKIVEYVDNPKGTVTNPYKASEIAELLTAGTTFDEDVYIKGKVSSILYTFSAQYGTATFWISDDGVANGVTENKKSTTEPTKDFECYSVYFFDNKQWAEGNAQIEVGDEVVICGKTTVYNGIAETSSKKAWVYSINGATTDANGVGNASAPFNVAGAKSFIDANVAAEAAAKEAGAAAPVFPDVCVKGKISEVVYTYSANYGTATFWMSDDGSAKDFEAYSVYYFDNQPWAEGNKQIAAGDEVVIKGQLTLYKTTYETSSKKAWLYSLNGATE